MKQEIRYYADNALKQAIKDWIAWLKDERAFSEHTVDAYARDIAYFLAFFEDKDGVSSKAPMSLKDLEQLQIKDFRAYIASDYCQKLDKASQTRKLSALRNFFRRLEQQELVHNPAVSIISSPRKKRKLPHALDVKQAFHLITVPEDIKTEHWVQLRNTAFFILLYGCGLRISEAANINIGDFDNGDFLRIKGKGRKERIVPLLPQVISAVNAYLEACPYTQNAQNGDPVFFGVRGERIRPRVIERQMEKLRAEIGLSPDMTPHSLRHSFATHLLAGGLNLRSIQELLGHSTLSTTQLYTEIELSKISTEYKKADLLGNLTPPTEEASEKTEK